MSEALIIRKRGRLPLPDGPVGDGTAQALQIDASLSTVGFKLTGDLLRALAGLAPSTALEIGGRLLAVVREMVGDHVQHNVYFKDFPANVPDTRDFWVACIRNALSDENSRDLVRRQLAVGTVNLLDLPTYGRYQHTFDEMVEAHDELLPLLSDRMTIIALGGRLTDEEGLLYAALAASTTPLSPDDLETLRNLAPRFVVTHTPDTVPIRENLAVINAVRLGLGGQPVLDQLNDVLRVACELSGGDVTLVERTRFRSFGRAERRALLRALDEIAVPAKLGDVDARRERWKRLGERLHPFEYTDRYPRAAEVFKVACRERRVSSLTARVERHLGAQDLTSALASYRSTPGYFYRSLDRLIRTATTPAELDHVVRASEDMLGEVSGRVILSMREHLDNRVTGSAGRRIFTNRAGRAWAAPDQRDALDDATVSQLITALDAEIARRLPRVDHVVVERDALSIALPLSGKAIPDGIGLLPRGSVTRVDADLLRFFVYWRQARERTDFDLSAMLFDDGYTNATWLSYTSLTALGGRHSGDVTDAPDGASEFIDLELATLPGKIVIPQVNVYSGEGFDDVAESFFGYMNRATEQRGLPFEPVTVRMKSNLRGSSRVALPLVFLRDDTGTWFAHWLHLFLGGRPQYNRVENNRISTVELVRAMAERRYLTVEYLIGLLRPATLTVLDPGAERPSGHHTYLGLGSIDEIRSLIPDQPR